MAYIQKERLTAMLREFAERYKPKYSNDGRDAFRLLRLAHRVAQECEQIAERQPEADVIPVSQLREWQKQFGNKCTFGHIMSLVEKYKPAEKKSEWVTNRDPDEDGDYLIYYSWEDIEGYDVASFYTGDEEYDPNTGEYGAGWQTMGRVIAWKKLPDIIDGLPSEVKYD